jgi:hypothetical protein
MKNTISNSSRNYDFKILNIVINLLNRLFSIFEYNSVMRIINIVIDL